MSDEQKPYGILTFSERNVSAVFSFGLLYAGTFLALWTNEAWPQFTLAVFLAPVLIWLSVRDLESYELPDTGVLAIVVISLMHVTFMVEKSLLGQITTAIGVTAFFWMFGEVYFRRSGQEGLGIGDAKLFGSGALLLGPWQIPELVLLPSLGGVAFHFMGRLRGQVTNTGIPFGPFIAYAIFILSFLDPLFL